MASLKELFSFKSQLATPPVGSANQGAPPRKAAKTPGTTYTAQGLQPPQLDTESGSSRPAVIREVVPELASPTIRRITYASMLNDAGVDVSLRALKTPVLGSEFYVDAASDNPQDQLIAEFVWANLSGGMSAPFINSIEDILRFFEDGYSVLEKVYEQRPWTPSGSGANTKNYTMLKKLAIRPESTISLPTGSYDDNGGLAQVTQLAIRADNSTQEVTIPISKLLVFTFNRKGGNVEGKSILRTAYPHWYYKNHLYKIDAIQKERHSLGVPKGKLMPGFNPQDKAILRTILRNLRTNEEAYVITPPNIDIEFAEVKGNLVNPIESIDHHNSMIMLNVLAAFLVHGGGGSSGGGRQTSATQLDMFMKALRYVANYVAEVVNMYLIPELVVWNFPTTNFPKLAVRNIGETRDLQMLAAAFANLFSQGAITADLETENWLRRTFDMPAKKEGAISTAPPPAPNGTQPQDNGGQNGNVKPGRIKTGNTGKPPGAPA